MSELTKRLRNTYPRDSGYAERANEAADRIEALEECLRALIVDITHSDHSPHDWSEQVVIAQARALLEE